MPDHASDREKHADLGFERLVFFSDAVFAIAITLLVLDLKPEFKDGRFDLMALLPNLLGFALSFYVVGRYWLAHHALFLTLKGYDRVLMSVNLLFLASIVFLPFATSVVTKAKPETGAVAFYTLSVSAVGLLQLLLTLAARRSPLLHHGETRGRTASRLVYMAAAPGVFLAATLIAFVNPTFALYSLVSLAPVSAVLDRVGPALQARIDGAAAKPV